MKIHQLEPEKKFGNRLGADWDLRVNDGRGRARASGPEGASQTSGIDKGTSGSKNNPGCLLREGEWGGGGWRLIRAVATVALPRGRRWY